MPAAPKWIPTVKRRGSIASINNNTNGNNEDNTGDANGSDTASINGSINSTTSTSKRRPLWRAKTMMSPPDEPSSKPLQKKLWENRKRSKDENEPKLSEAMAVDLEVVRNTLSARDQELEESKTQVTQLEEKHGALSDDLEAAKNEADRHGQELEEWKARGAEMEGKCEALMKDLESANGQATVQKQALEDLTEKYEALLKGMENIQGDAAVREQEWKIHGAQVHGENEELKQSVDALKKQVDDMQKKIRESFLFPIIKWSTGIIL